MRQLKTMVGEMIIVRIPILDPEEMSLVRLHGVDENGLWIESQTFTESMMKKYQIASSKTTPLIFVPFARIEFVLGSLRALALSESAFGLRDDG